MNDEAPTYEYFVTVRPHPRWQNFAAYEFGSSGHATFGDAMQALASNAMRSAERYEGVKREQGPSYEHAAGGKSE